MTEEQLLAQGTLSLLDWYNPAHEFDQSNPGCDKEHIRSILQQVVDGECTGTKAHRFIGWAQAVLCMEGFLTLDDARNINRKVIEELYNESGI